MFQNEMKPKAVDSRLNVPLKGTWSCVCLLVFTFIVVLCFASRFDLATDAENPRVPASINRAVLVIVKPSRFFGSQGLSFSPETIDSYNQIKAQEKPFDVGQIIPSGLSPSDESNIIFQKIADQSISSFFSSAQVRATPFGQTATTVEQKMKQDVTVGQGVNMHKFTFQVQAFQSSAKIDYQGFTNATLKYQARESSLGLEVYEKITKTKELVLGQLNKPEDRVSSVNVRWNF